jgi:hypothetical protein
VVDLQKVDQDLAGDLQKADQDLVVDLTKAGKMVKSPVVNKKNMRVGNDHVRKQMDLGKDI